eukprot:1376823-Pyramimonas_sp.AAC.1
MCAADGVCDVVSWLQYRDKEFTGEKAIGKVEGKTLEDCDWLRPEELERCGELMNLFEGKIEPKDVAQ